eukprot:Platyproteum_vivax@DN656_c0_g1_i1.p1
MPSESFKLFQDFDWSNSEWLKYFDGLYPTPPQTQVLKWKKKWYKKNIDPSLDLNEGAEPTPPPSAKQHQPQHFSGQFGAPPPPASYAAAKQPNLLLFAAVGHISALFFYLCYLVGYGWAYNRAIQTFLVTYVVDSMCRYGVPRLNTEWWMPVVFDDCVQSTMMLVFLMMGAPMFIGLASPTITSALAISQIYSISPLVQRFTPLFLQKYMSDGHKFLESKKIRVMQYRANAEVMAGVLLAVMAIVKRAGFLPVLLYWTWMRARFMASAFTQSAFRSVDGQIRKVLPAAVLAYYDKAQKWIYSFVDPAQQRSTGEGANKFVTDAMSKCTLM